MHLDAVCRADLGGKLAGNDAFDNVRVVWHGVGLTVRRDDIVHQQGAHLVAGNGGKGAVGRAGHHANTVGVGVGGNDKVGANLICKCDPEGKDVGILGIRLFDRGKIPVDHHLLIYRVKMLQTDAAHDFGNQLVPGSVQGRIDDLQAVCHVFHRGRIDRLLFNRREVFFVDFRPNDANDAAFYRRIKIG